MHAVKGSPEIPSPSQRRWFVHCLPLGGILFTSWRKLVFSQRQALSGMSHMSFINKNEKMESLLLHNCSSFARPNLSKPRCWGGGGGAGGIKGTLI